MRSALRFGIALLVAQWGLTRDIAAQDAPAQKKESRQSVTQPATQPGKKVTSRQSSPTKRPGKPPTGNKEALALARRVVAYAGGPKGLSDVHNLIFTCAAGEYRVRSLWDRKTTRVRIEILQWPKVIQPITDRPMIAVHELVTGKALLSLFLGEEEGKNAPLRGRGKPFRGQPIDLWYPLCMPLLAPLLVLDSGVNVSVEPRKEGDAAGIQRLRIESSSVQLRRAGLATYVMQVQRDSGRVLTMERAARGQRQPGYILRFEDYRKIGRLILSSRRREVLPESSQRPARSIHYTDIAINVALPKDIWTSTKLCLSKVGVQVPQLKPAKDLPKPAASQPGK